MRTYGRTSSGQWVTITDPNYVQLATLVQVLKLQQGESPIYGNYGIPAIQSVQAQTAPQIALDRTVAQFSQYFSRLTIKKVSGGQNLTYNINAVFLDGTVIQSTLAT